MTNGFTLPNGNMNSWLKAVATVGLPSVLAIVLTIFLIYSVNVAHAQMQANLNEVQATVIDNAQKLDANVAAMHTLIRISRQTCINTAPDSTSRLRCLE